MKQHNQPDGARVDVSAEFISRLHTEIDGTPIYRLLIRTGDTESAVIVAPSYGGLPLPGRTGATYSLRDAVAITADPETMSDISGTCRACGGALRSGTALDAIEAGIATFVQTADVTIPCLVADVATTFHHQGEDSGSGPMVEPISVPDAVCTDCGSTVASLPEC